MKKHTPLPIAAVLGGVAAFALRLLQNRTGFEAATGLPVSGNFAGIALVICLLLLAVVLFLLTRQLSDSTEPVFPEDFITGNSTLLFFPVMGLLLIALAGIADLYEGFTTGNLLTQLKAAADPYAVTMEDYFSGFSPRSQQLLGILSLLTAIALFPAVAACRKNSDEAPKPFSGSLLLAPPVVLVVRLVLTYRLDSVNPALEAYYVELLALVFLTLAFYRLSSFAFNAGRTSRFALYTGLAVVFSLAALADGGPHLSSLLLYAGSTLTLFGFLLLRLSRAENE